LCISPLYNNLGMLDFWKQGVAAKGGSLSVSMNLSHRVILPTKREVWRVEWSRKRHSGI
jgi:hypothetical protein